MGDGQLWLHPESEEFGLRSSPRTWELRAACWLSWSKTSPPIESSRGDSIVAVGTAHCRALPARCYVSAISLQTCSSDLHHIDPLGKMTPGVMGLPPVEFVREGVIPVQVIEESVVVARPVEDVFSFVEDLEREPLWHSRTVEAHFLDEGPNRVGRRCREVVTFPGRRMEFLLEISRYEPPHRIEVRVVEGPYPGEQLFRCESEGDGCRLTNVFPSPAAGGLLGGVTAPLITWLAAREARSDLQTLRDILEAEPRSDS